MTSVSLKEHKSLATGTNSWHTMELPAVFQTLAADSGGLSSSEAAARLKIYGPNQLPQKPPPAFWEIFLHQFRSPLIYILLAAAVVSALLQEFVDAAFIAAVLALNAAIGSYQEWRAELSTRALQKLLRIRASVYRDGEVYELDAEQVVPGDIVWLESGNRVPADLRLLSGQGLEIDESLMTGESLPVAKNPADQPTATATLGDRHNMAYAGSVVVRGRGKGVVIATGSNTAVGQLALDVVDTAGGKAPLILRLERFTKAIAVAVLTAGVVVALVGVLGRGYSLSEMFLFAVALAVSAIPEGLPVALTVALSIATARMARRNVIVRRLAAVEGLGSCTLIASDKTGTLTCNELTARELVLASGESFRITGEGFVPEGQVQLADRRVAFGEVPRLDALVRAAILCNEADLHHANGTWVWRGDPTDIALLTMAVKLGCSREPMLDQYPQEAQIPFEPERRFAASFHKDNDSIRVFVKGAPERVLQMCAHSDPQAIETHRQTAQQMAANGYRVLAFAEGLTTELYDKSDTPSEPTNLHFLGFVGMIDPPRPGVLEAIQSCHAAGITVCMITGDHPITARAIAANLGLAGPTDLVVTGEQLENKNPNEVEQLVRSARVFARVSPRQKLELVEAARRAGHFVAVTGDGVNDAPALRAANIGVAMGKSGTDIAREAADLVIADDNFATIVAGVEEGRIAYDNVRKVIYLLISTGAAEVLLVLLALAAGMPLPLIAVQFLWLNLVTNGIQDVALAFEPGEGDALARQPRATTEPIFNQLMIERTVVAAAVMAGVCFSAFYYWIEVLHHSEYTARNLLLLLMVLFQNIHIGNCRSETTSALFLSPFRSPILLGGAILAFLVHVASMHLPFMQQLLRTEPVSLSTWFELLGLALTVFVVMELHKWTWRLRHGKTLAK